MRTDFARDVLHMRFFKYIVTIIVVGLLSACSNGRKNPAQQDVERKMNQTFDSARHYTAEQRQQIEKRFNRGIDSLDQQIDKLNSRAQKLKNLTNRPERMGQSARNTIDKQIRNLKTEETKLREQLVHLRNSGDTAWVVLEQHVRKSYRDLKDGVEKADKEIMH